MPRRVADIDRRDREPEVNPRAKGVPMENLILQNGKVALLR